jgi:hypothetical protein
MTTQQGLRGWIGHDLLDEEGQKIGRVEDVYADDMTGRPEWISVKTGWFGSHVSFVPLDRLQSSDDFLVSPWPKDRVKDAPHIEPDQHLSGDEERMLYRHYGMNYSGQRPDTGRSGTDQADPGGVKLRRSVETEYESVQVPVRKEHVSVVREPTDDGNR